MSIRCLNLPQSMSLETPLYRLSCNSSRMLCRESKKQRATGITSQLVMLPSRDSFRKVEKSSRSLLTSPVAPLAFPKYRLQRTVNPKASIKITLSKSSRRCVLLILSKCTLRPNPSICLNFQTSYLMPKGDARRNNETG